MVVPPPRTASSTFVPEPVKPKSRSPHEQQHRVAGLPPGIDLDNVISVKESRLELTPPTSSVPNTSYSLRNRGEKQSKLAYDLKYHPMDDRIRPSQAAKRRSAHGEEQVPSDHSNEVSTIIDTEADASSDEQCETGKWEPANATRGKKRSQTLSPSRSIEGTRRSTRKVPDPKASYNMDIHPQDSFLIVSSDGEDEVYVSTNKRRRFARTRRKDGPQVHKTACQKKNRRMDNNLSEGMVSNSEMVFDSGGTGSGKESATNIIRTPSSVSSVLTPPPHGIRRREGLDVWNLQSGQRYFRHDRDAWPVSPGQPFEIFNEKLEDQLAREAMEASPLNYEHDDKENSTNNANFQTSSNIYEGLSVMPVSQYRQSSEDRQQAQDRTLVNYALYDDPPSESYGLHGSDGARDDPVCSLPSLDIYSILASGKHLPRGQTQGQPEDHVHDSVLGSSSNNTDGPDSFLGNSSDDV
ncbi:hypothetical protein BDW02DRAFT_156129 [Decorospora gaudefroyi]|uniref:Uncharacterized protein n=1 Tax=Decorospora gaudefroyi TaxID=184978 RepID=A0A6A5L007_9PLEO|nr:hypothetical protein BDW02DRAFT_156129 [Decorospora gaudefroyi]